MLPLTPSAPAHLAPLFDKKCSSRCCWFGRLLLPKVPCFALWSCFPMCRAAGCVSRWCLALRCGAASRWCHRLPRSGNLFRTDFRFAPSLPQRFACGLLPFTRDMGVHGLCGRVPDSAGSICLPDEAAAWPGVQVLDGKCCCCLAWVPFLQITARTNPCSRHLWGTLARSVASI